MVRVGIIEIIKTHTKYIIKNNNNMYILLLVGNLIVY